MNKPFAYVCAMKHLIAVAVMFGIADAANADVFCSEQFDDCSYRIEFLDSGNFKITLDDEVWSGSHISAFLGDMALQPEAQYPDADKGRRLEFHRYGDALCETVIAADRRRSQAGKLGN
jgi:hypothetical protein